MYITSVFTKNKSGEVSHECILLRETYRQGAKVKNRTIANLTHCNPKEVEAMRLALKHKDDLTVLRSLDEIEITQGMSLGAVWVVYEMAKRLGVEKALGVDRAGKLAMVQVICRIIDQGSRLSAVRFCQTHSVCDTLGIREGFNEEHLYKNLAWLCENQDAIEKRLFQTREGNTRDLFLYDITSSYMEGKHNELAGFGYSRDGKPGKKQVLVGLLCDQLGDPVSVEVFAGNVRDFQTLGSQIKKVAQAFGCERVTMVGDRGMIKSSQIDTLNETGFHYITAITKPQIEAMIRSDVLQTELFDQQLCEIEEQGLRYILRRNPLRAEQMRQTRQDKKQAILQLIERKNDYLKNHSRAKVSKASNHIQKKMDRLQVSKWLNIEQTDRSIRLVQDEQALEEISKLDGCYVLKSDVSKTIDKQTIHDRYKDLALVESAFKLSKTVLLEMRPWNVRTEKSTRGHAVVVMLAYLMARHLHHAWENLNVTVQEGLNILSMICSMTMTVNNLGACHRIPNPGPFAAELLNAVNITLPEVLPQLGAVVVSRKTLASKPVT
jgi:transposase